MKETERNREGEEKVITEEEPESVKNETEREKKKNEGRETIKE